MPLVTFQSDAFPYVKGDVVDLDSAELARVDAVAKLRDLDSPYVKGDERDSVVETVEGNHEANALRATADRAAIKENLVDQAAQLEAQRNSVAEPANVDALGVVAETAQVVTGTEPVADVVVTNPQEATDPGSGVGAEVKTSKAKK